MMRQGFVTAAIVAVVGFNWVAASDVSAAVITLDRIAFTGEPVPGATQTFTEFHNPATDGTSVVFWGKGVPAEGVFRGLPDATPAGPLATVAPAGPVPDAPGNRFSGSFDRETSVDEAGTVAYAAGSFGASLRQGVYTTTAGGASQRVVDTTSARPQGGTFANYTFTRPTIGAGRTSFVATGPASPIPGSTERGIYTNATPTGELAAVVVENTPLNTFGRPAASGQRLLYRYTTPTTDQLRLYDNGTTTTAFNSGDTVPGLGTVFETSDPSFQGNDFAFNGSAGGRDAVIARINGSILKIADTTTPLPEGGGTFGGFLYEPSIDAGRVAFVAIGLPFPPLKHGVYLYDGGSILKVANVNDLLDGKTPQDFIIGPEALSGDLLTFRVVFTDQSQGIYVATVPEPGSLLLLGAATGWIALRRRARRA